METRQRLFVLGLGNVLLRDDGVGIQAIRALRRIHLPGMQAIEVGTAIPQALPLLEDARRLIVIDAMRAGSPPGTIYTFSCLTQPSSVSSLHQAALNEVLDVLPERPSVYLIGVEPAIIEHGMELSAEVKKALPKIVDATRFVAAQWIRKKNLPEPFRGMTSPSAPNL